MPDDGGDVRQGLPVCAADSLVLGTTWRFSRLFSGCFVDEGQGEAIIFTGDPMTSMAVRCLSDDGALLFDVPLDTAIARIGDIQCIGMLARDRFFLLDDRGERAVVLDTTGAIISMRSSVEARCDGYGDLYELYASSHGLGLLNGKFYLGPALLGLCGSPRAFAPTGDPVQDDRRYYAHATGGHQLAEIDPSSGAVRFGARGLLGHLTDTPRETLGMSHVAIANGSLFVYSDYSPFAHLIDTNTLTVRSRIPIRYARGEPGITPPPIGEEDISRDGANHRLATKALILAFTYDRASKHYLASVVHEIPDGSPAEEQGWRRNWSLVVLDSTFSKVGEYVFSGKEYSGSVLLSTRRGTYVLKKDLDPQAFMRPKVFHRLRIP